MLSYGFFYPVSKHQVAFHRGEDVIDLLAILDGGTLYAMEVILCRSLEHTDLN